MTPPAPFTDTILDRLIADGHADAVWSYHVLAACEGPEALAASLDGTAVRTPRGTEPAGSARVPTPEPPGAYLKSITVQGFRGIAAASSLALTPGPGLTLVVGRNGSGKSSFAEGLEVLLTGGNKRWDGRSSVWKDGWRCLHQPHPCVLRAEFHAEGLGTVTVERRWDEGAALDGSTAWFQAAGKERRPYVDLGWLDAIRTHRPLLPYTELGTVFDRPSEIHDALSQVLGLGELDDVLKRLQAERRTREQEVAASAALVPGLTSRLQDVADATGDTRAAAAMTALKGRKPNLDALAAVLDGRDHTSADDTVAALRRTIVPVPDEGTVRDVVQELDAAGAAVAEVQDTDAGRARALAQLLEQALRFHGSHPSADCPVCGTNGALGTDWHRDTCHALTNLRTKADVAERAHLRLRAAMTKATALMHVPEASFESAVRLEMASAATALRAARQWNAGAVLTDPRAVGEHLRAHAAGLIEVLRAFNDEVQTALAAREDRWSPIATELAQWLPRARAAAAAQAQVAELKDAEKWFKGVQADVRAERFRPIADEAIALWRQLRQHSNVELAGVSLEGGATRRSVELDVTVDGVEGAALGVMSQGELNALALSLFMPRAALPDSPFRFMVIDDPVQSMDPSRVDGLARALHATARKRQVVVFTHDDRLHEAVERLQIPASVIEVTRGLHSAVTATVSRTAVRKYIDDAMSVVRTRDLPDHVKQRVVPGLCRSAVEAACMDVVRRRRLKNGDGHVAVERLLDEHRTLRARLALALFDDTEKAGQVPTALDNRWNGAGQVFQALNEGAHAGFDGDLEGLARGAERLAAAMQRDLR